uniref:Sorting nexin-25-like n=1 Tax=Saccoglossus kowalevskii TaxID=10224 RepID=A0ABM0M950_SACKO|nr:PREDICTED: sorting nexin-25-like [Saccoglossus kowalevskii]
MTVGIFAVIYQFGILYKLFCIALYLCVGVLGFILGFVVVACKGRKRRPSQMPGDASVANALLCKMAEYLEQDSLSKPRRTVISKNMDEAIKEVFDLIVQHYILIWYSDLSLDSSSFIAVLEDDMWESIERLMHRFAKVDLVRFITKDTVTKLHSHFQDLKQSASRNPDDITSPFYLHPCLNSEDAELEFLRKAADVLIWTMTPKRIGKCATARHLIREIIACQVMKPCVDMICDPDYINLTILSHLEYREQLAEKHKRTYAYAASYEDFIKLINACHDIEELKQIRYQIMTEIMQATTIQNLKKERGIETEASPKGQRKGDLLKARNLKRYINQCTVSKSQCEKRIRLLGGPEYQLYGQDSPTHDTSTESKQRQVLTFSEIMDNPHARKYFMAFLKREKRNNLLGFWIAVENLKFLNKKDLAHHASEAYQSYVAIPKQVKLERSHVKGMEAFLVGNKGPESFFDAHKDIYNLLDEEFYPSFIVSDFYLQYMGSFEESEDVTMDTTSDYSDRGGSLQEEDFSVDETDSNESSSIAEQTNYAVSTLQMLDERLANKIHTWHSIKNSQRPDSKILLKLERDIEAMRLERRQLESHIDRTDMWCEFMGQWQVNICNAEVIQEQDKVVPYYVIVVHLNETTTQEVYQSTTGWVVSHQLKDFYNLHERLKECCSWLHRIELPQVSKSPFKSSIDKEFLEKSKKQLSDYLISVLADESLRYSEALYSFLIPSPSTETVKKTPSKEERKPAFSLATIFKNLPGDFFSQQDSEDKEEEEGDEESAPDRRDSIAEPLYALIGEIFELKGVFKWLRKTLIVFVQVTFGGTINKQIREGVDWVVSEPMLIYYINYFRDAMWPNGEPALPLSVRSEDDKITTKLKARLKLLKNIPDAMQNLLGKRNSKLGAIKIFNAFQDVRTNKHLFYVLFELVLLEVCPELKDPKLLKKVQEDQRQTRQQHKTKMTMAMAM